MLAAQLSHRHPSFGLTQDRKDLRLSLSACLHSKNPRSSCRENSTYAASYFQGGLPADFVVSQRNTCKVSSSVSQDLGAVAGVGQVSGVVLTIAEGDATANIFVTGWRQDSFL